MDDQPSYLSPAEGFARIAYTYDARHSGIAVLERERTEVLRALGRVSGLRIADIGCGTGRWALEFPRLGAAASIGVDLSPEMLERARYKARDREIPVTLQTGDLLGEISIEGGTLDAAVCAFTLTFVDDLNAAFRALSRILDSRGTLVVSEHHPHGLWTERAAGTQVKHRAPFLRFTDCDGQECRIPRHPHQIGDYMRASSAANLTLESVSEPLLDGLPGLLVMKLRRCPA